MAAARNKYEQGALFSADVLGKPLPVVGEQKDIRYFGTVARNVLNPPETTKMGFWSINPYIGCAFGCAYCYARYAHRWVVDRHASANPDHAELQHARSAMVPWLAFERRIFVKTNAADVLRRTLRHGSERHLALLENETIVIGTATDPFQPAERRFRVTRSVLEVLAEHPGLSVAIITKSPLITRDIDLLTRINRHSSLSIHLSLISTDRELARRIEPRAPTPEARLRALARLSDAGIEVGINVMPVLPAITDGRDALEHLVKSVKERGAAYLNACALRLRSSARQRYLPFIEQEFPHLAKRYWATYAFDHKVSATYSERLKKRMREICAAHELPYGRWGAADTNEDQSALVEARFAGEEQLELAMESAAVSPVGALGRLDGSAADGGDEDGDGDGSVGGGRAPLDDAGRAPRVGAAVHLLVQRGRIFHSHVGNGQLEAGAAHSGDRVVDDADR
jgi:DNA repair photolyase